MKLLSIFIVLILNQFDYFNTSRVLFREERAAHKHKDLSDEDVKNLSEKVNITNFHALLKPFMVKRAINTESHTTVKQFILSELLGYQFVVEEDKFTAEVPGNGSVIFTNIIGRSNPKAPRVLALVCHYDAKDVSSLDAVPCALMLTIAKTLIKHLRLLRGDISFDLVFLDGHQPFDERYEMSYWGARHLAEKWDRSPVKVSWDSSSMNMLDKLDMMVFLEKLGLPNRIVFCNHPETAHWFKRLSIIEKRLKAMGLLNEYCSDGLERRHAMFYNRPLYFQGSFSNYPFLEKDVPVMQIVPHNSLMFLGPKSVAMDASYLDASTIEDLLKILQIFVLEYFYE